MSYEYDGITTDAIFLLERNRFENSKEFYEAHKAQINQTVIKPMRQIAVILSNELSRVDPHIQTNPTRMTSRIRRDTRFTKDKSLYRDHVWISFERPKKEWEGYPGMWMEISPRGYSYGVGPYAPSPTYLELLRQQMCAQQKAFLQAAEQVRKTGALLAGEDYKRKKPGEYPKELDSYYNKKNFYFIKTVSNLATLADDRIVQELQQAYAAFIPMYQFLSAVSDQYHIQQHPAY